MTAHELPPFWVVIPAAGIGSRMRADRPKQYLQLAGRTILEHTLDCFLDHPRLKSNIGERVLLPRVGFLIIK